MSKYGLKNTDPAYYSNPIDGTPNFQITPDEIDRYERYHVILPASSGNVGTAAAGTSTQAKAMVITNKYPDYPRNLAGAVAGSSDMGGTWVVNGKDQFGSAITETITIGTAANGGTTDGTMVFAQMVSGTFTFTDGAVGSGTPTLQYVTTGTTVKFGLPFRIGGTDDVKSITWAAALTGPTAINGGTIGAYVGTGGIHGYNNWFRGTANVAGTQVYTVLAKPTYDASSDTIPQAGL